MGELYDDLVLEVISWLPLKDAIRCKILNKNFSTHISSRCFEHKHFVQSNQIIYNLLYRSNSATQIFRQLRLDHHHPLNKPEIINICPSQIGELVSCGGLVILFSTHSFDYVLNPFTISCYFLLNPVTREYLYLERRGKHDGWNVGAVGLAVDSRNLSYRYIVVVVYVKKHQTCSKNQVCKFITFTSCSRRWEESNEEDFVCELSEFLKKNIQPVYLNDTLHWLREDGSILAFDVEKSRARIIQGPVKLIFDKRLEYEIWFGGIEGSLVFVCSFKSTIVIYVYDHITWKIQHKIANNDYKNGFPMLFDGKRLFLILRNKVDEDGEIFMYNIVTNSWEKIGMMVLATTYCGQYFIPFVSTLAKVYSGDELNPKRSFLLN